LAELRELIERARQGDKTAMPRLRELLDDTPVLWKQIGDMAKHVETAWIKLLSGGDLFTQECLNREADRRRADLLGDDPTPIERHLVERVVATWLQVQHAEIQMGNSEGAREQRLNFLHKRLEVAGKQHAAAINQLVKIRNETKAKPPTSTKKTVQDSRRKQPGKRARRRVIAP